MHGCARHIGVGGVQHGGQLRAPSSRCPSPGQVSSCLQLPRVFATLGLPVGCMQQHRQLPCRLLDRSLTCASSYLLCHCHSLAAPPPVMGAPQLPHPACMAPCSTFHGTPSHKQAGHAGHAVHACNAGGQLLFAPPHNSAQPLVPFPSHPNRCAPRPVTTSRTSS